MFFSLRNGVIAASGQRVHVRAVVGRVDHDGVVGDAEIVELLQNLPDVAVVLDHAVGIFGLAVSRSARDRLAAHGCGSACAWS